MSIRSLTFQVVALVAIPAFAKVHTAPDYEFTFSSFAREGAMTLRTEGEAKGTYTLGQELSRTITWPNGRTSTLETPLFDKQVSLDALVGDGMLEGEALRPISYVPNGLTVTAVSIVTPGDVAPKTLTLTVGGTPYVFSHTDETETVTLRGTWDGDAGTHSGTVHTYDAPKDEVIALSGADATFSVAFPATDASGQQQNRTIFLLDGAPFLRLFGTAEITHHVFTIDQQAGAAPQSLKKLLENESESFVDAANTVVVVDFEGQGGAVDLDAAIKSSPLIFGSAVDADQAAIHFCGGATVTSPLTFRDGATPGGVSVYGPADGQALTWDPAALLLLCDATLKTTLPTGEGSWFTTHATAIPAGRTFRIELEEAVEDSDALPNLSFAAANSVLELALAGNLQPPTKYTSLMTMQSGTLVFDQDVTLPSLTLGGKGLESTVILRNGHTYAFTGYSQGAGIETHGSRVTLIQEGGTLTLGSASTGSASTGAAPFALGAEETVVEVRGGTMTCASALEVATEGTSTDIAIDKGATLTLVGGLSAGADDTTATLDLTVAGTLQLSEDLAMTPALRRTLTLAGGTIESTVSYPPDAVYVICGDGGTSDGEGLLDVVGGGTLTGSLVVDAASGQGDLVLDEYATLKTLRDFTGTVSGTVSGAGTLEAIAGSLGEVILGDDWLANAAGKRLGDVLTGWKVGDTAYAGASGFSGTIGFTAGKETAKKTLDFSDLDELTSLGMAFRVANHQNIIMRLDQYADATIRWPDDPQGITLTLIESGAYGGELTLPHFPHVEDEAGGVEFKFATFNPEGGYTVRTEGYSHTHTEDGVNDTLTWDNPVFTGEGAWIDIEFNGDTRNTGWFTLGDYNGNPVTTDDQRNRYNGLLAGDVPYVVLEQTPTTTPSITDSHQADFVDSKHPAQAHGSLPLHYRPFVALSSLEYPEAWTVSLRLSAPNAAHTCILALGHNYTGDTAGIPQYEGDVYTLIFATGDTPNEICLWVVPGVGEDTPKPDAPAFTVTLADATAAQHTFSVICDGKAMSLYVDGAWLGEQALPGEGARLTNGLQVGVQLGGTSIPTALQAENFAVAATEAAGGSIDFLRFYKGAMPEAAMVEVADRTPYVRENLRYVRYVPIDTAPDGFTKTVPEGGETWRQDGAWQEETWDGSAWTATGTYVAEPAEGAYLRLLVDSGDHALQVNVERRVDEQANDYFYSPNRNYAALVVEPQAGNAAAGTLRLVPYGVDPAAIAKTDDALTQAVDDAVPGSAWFTKTADLSDANNTGFRYGKLRFTGGADDPITSDPAIPNLYGSAYLLSGGDASASGEGTLVEKGEIAWGSGISGMDGSKFFQRGTQDVTIRYATAGATPMAGIYDAGVCYLSKLADVVLAAAADQTQTVRITWKRYVDYDTKDPLDEPIVEVKREIVETAMDPTSGAQMNTLEMVAGMSLTRGMVDEVARWQLTGPVVLRGTATLDDHVLGHDGLPEADGQDSEDVWVPVFAAGSTWKFYDDTRVEGGADNANGALTGLFARGVQTPGRLYLDFTVGTADGKAKPNTGDFSKQAWYRYGYEADANASTLSGMKPERASANDFAQAVAFQIRLSEKTGDVTLTLDEVPKARVQTFHVEEEAGAQEPLTLKLERAEEIPALKIWKSVVAAARLDVSNNNTGVATSTSWEGNALNLRPAEGIRTPVQRGNATHGHGAFIVGATEVDWDFGSASSVPRLEVIPGAELTFTVGQDFRRQDIGGITLVAQGKAESTFPMEGSDDGPTNDDLKTAARIHHRSAEPFLGQDVELGEGAIFGFHADAAASEADTQNEGVVLSGELRLTGNATLRADFESASGGAGAARLPHFVAAGGIRAMKQGLTLIVDAPGSVNWHCHTATLTGKEGFRLWKTGPGTMTFYATTPPSVTGKVTVEEGTLAVTAAANTPVGAKGLHVKQGAKLADSGRMSGANLRLALIPGGATLSGGGAVKGILRLESGATYLAKQGEALTADGISVDSSLEADINVTLPEGYKDATPYLVANRAERNVRARFLPMKGEARWDSIAWIDNAASTASTTYAARPPKVPAPTDYKDYVEGKSPTTITGTIEEPLINQYQNAGHAYIGATFGRTRAGTHALNDNELSDALLCFSNISAFVPASKTQGTREYVDGTNFYVGYEFGISRQALVEIGNTKYVVLEVSVKSVFDDGVSFPGVDFNDVQRNFEADFNSSTELSFDLIDANGKAQSLDGELVEEVTGMDGATPVPDNAVATYAATPGVRWFRIPYARLLEAARDGNIRLRATATFPYAQPTSTR